MSYYSAHYQSPLGLIEVRGTTDALTSVLFIDQAPDEQNESDSTDVIDSCIRQLNEYFQGKRKQFELPLALTGTDFQQQVWKGITSISFGSTLSYKNLAGIVNKPTAVRAVGSATGKNQFAIIIPCHRVIGSRNGLHGYAWGVWRKKKLLEYENNRWD